jgi:hypothetical protein
MSAMERARALADAAKGATGEERKRLVRAIECELDRDLCERIGTLPRQSDETEKKR